MNRNSTLSTTVIVRAHNDAKGLPRLLDDLAQQSVRPDEIIVVDNGSTDTTRVIAASESRFAIRVLTNSGSISQALNVGLAAASGSIIFQLKADFRVAPNYVEDLLNHFQNRPELGGVGGLHMASSDTQTGWVIAEVLSLPITGAKHYHAVAEVDFLRFGAYRSGTLMETRGWDEDISVNQDYDLAQKIRSTGRTLLVDPTITTSFDCSRSLRQLAKEYFGYGYSKSMSVRKHRRMFRGDHILPSLIVAFLTAMVVLAVSNSALFSLGVVAYFTAITLASIKAPLRTVKSRLTAVSAISIIHLCYGVGFILGIPSSINPFKNLRIGKRHTPKISF